MPGFINYKKGASTRSASDKVYQLLGHGRLFSPGTPTFSTTKTCRHDTDEIFLKEALNTINQSTSIKDKQIHESEHRCNRETYIPSAGAARMLVNINGQFTM